MMACKLLKHKRLGSCSGTDFAVAAAPEAMSCTHRYHQFDEAQDSGGTWDIVAPRFCRWLHPCRKEPQMWKTIVRCLAIKTRHKANLPEESEDIEDLDIHGLLQKSGFTLLNGAENLVLVLRLGQALGPMVRCARMVPGSKRLKRWADGIRLIRLTHVKTVVYCKFCGGKHQTWHVASRRHSEQNLTAKF